MQGACAALMFYSLSSGKWSEDADTDASAKVLRLQYIEIKPPLLFFIGEGCIDGRMQMMYLMISSRIFRAHKYAWFEIR
ncbi:hypothetical protein HYPSUDRAFT_46770 [Hypholoma sublateritium FD-334 SS-4]|uniref:Uncharacterized protein n=1 Tax=Hypholoma sublateritium (strain FD-334 SS-4) TaxID=945553 RepID=A0A0D2KQX8_HYPSF|nr:hypothetical protein HYPSUDRAFT_46770 [Hypholoma sublateritium FD-334 SS-4]